MIIAKRKAPSLCLRWSQDNQNWHSSSIIALWCSPQRGEQTACAVEGWHWVVSSSFVPADNSPRSRRLQVVLTAELKAIPNAPSGFETNLCWSYQELPPRKSLKISSLKQQSCLRPWFGTLLSRSAQAASSFWMRRICLENSSWSYTCQDTAGKGGYTGRKLL